MSQKIVLIEPNPTGHRLMYVRLIIQEASARGASVTLVLHEDRYQDPAVETHLASVAGQFALRVTGDFTLEAVAALTHEYGADITIVPDGDNCAINIARRGSWQGRGQLRVLVMRTDSPPTRIPGIRWLRSRIKWMLLNRANEVDRVQIVLLASAVSSSRPTKSRFAVAHDPVEMSATDEDAARFRSAANMERERYWFGVLGAITPRKNLPMVARAILTAGPTDVGLLIAGVCDVATLTKSISALDRIRKSRGQVVVINRLLTENELDAAVRVTDCIILAHSNEGPSGLFGKAMAVGTRVIAAGSRSLREDVSFVGANASWCELSAKALGNEMSLSKSRKRPDPFPMPNPAGFARALIG